jgi:hypothetical protein
MPLDILISPLAILAKGTFEFKDPLISLYNSILLRTLPYYASKYGKPRSERSGDDYPDREDKPMLRELRAILH